MEKSVTTAKKYTDRRYARCWWSSHCWNWSMTHPAWHSYRWTSRPHGRHRLGQSDRRGSCRPSAGQDERHFRWPKVPRALPVQQPPDPTTYSMPLKTSGSNITEVDYQICLVVNHTLAGLHQQNHRAAKPNRIVAPHWKCVWIKTRCSNIPGRLLQPAIHSENLLPPLHFLHTTAIMTERATFRGPKRPGSHASHQQSPPPHQTVHFWFLIVCQPQNQATILFCNNFFEW